MFRSYMFLFFMVLSIPAFLGINALHANRCGELRREINRLQREQVEIVERNRHAAAEVTELLSTARLENVARYIPGLGRMRPENVLLINITGGRERGL